MVGLIPATRQTKVASCSFACAHCSRRSLMKAVRHLPVAWQYPSSTATVSDFASNLISGISGCLLLSAYIFAKRIKRDVEVCRCLVGLVTPNSPDSRLRATAFVSDCLIRQSARRDLFNDVVCCIHTPNYTRMNSLVNARMDIRLRKQLRI